MSTAATAAPRGAGARVAVQRFGTFLSGMIMPNMGAFIAWGAITAFFIPTGFTPNETLGKLVAPMITYLLPLLIGYTGGKLVYEVRGGVVGAVATMGVIVGTEIPMFMGAMIMGPLTAWVMKHADKLWHEKVKAGLEMLVSNFSAGIVAAIMAVFGMLAIGPVVSAFSSAAGGGVQFLVNNGLLPLTSILIEPAKVLFLNNAVNHGILTPLGTQQSLEQGKSILFLLEANPGPGLGLLLAYSLFGKGLAKASAPGAALIQFLGGIHEIFFPYVLMKPVIILATIAGGMTGIFTLVVTGAGLRAPASPGSIFAVLAMAPLNSLFGVLLSVVLAATVSFIVASIILRTSKDKSNEGDLLAATGRMESMKGKKSSVASALTGGAAAGAAAGPIHSIVFACDAGMGSSAMGASVLRNKIKAAGFNDVKVTNASIAALKDEYDLVVSHQDLTDRAQAKTQSARHVSVENFMNSPAYDEVVELIREENARPAAGGEPAMAGGAPAPAAAAAGISAPAGAAAAAAAPSAAGAGTAETGILTRDRVIPTGTATDRDAAMREAGQLLVDSGAVEAAYIDSIFEREQSVSTYMGNLLAIPHGTNQAKSLIKRSAMSFVRYPDGIDWNGKPVKFVVGIAGANDEHLGILQAIARIFSDKEKVAELEQAAGQDEILAILGKVNEK